MQKQLILFYYMKNYKNDFEELKKVSIILASMARNQAITKNTMTENYNNCIKKMFDLGCFSEEYIFDSEILIDDCK